MSNLKSSCRAVGLEFSISAARTRLSEWLIELPNYPASLKVGPKSGGNGGDAGNGRDGGVGGDGGTWADTTTGLRTANSVNAAAVTRDEGFSMFLAYETGCFLPVTVEFPRSRMSEPMTFTLNRMPCASMRCWISASCRIET